MKFAACAAAISVALAAGCGGSDDDAQPAGTAGEDGAGATGEAQEGTGVTVGLMQLSTSGVTGEVTLTPARQSTRVVVRVDQADPAEPYSASIRPVRCEDLVEESEVAFELNPVAEEPSDTVVDAALEILLDEPNSVVLQSSKGLAACADVAAAPDES